MKRWTRWQYAVPRFLLCVVIAIAAHFWAGGAVRSIAMRTGTQLLGAHVVAEDGRISLSDGHVLLGAISVADPYDSDQCWFTAEGCELEVETAPLLAKQVVISTARMNGVRIGSSATEGVAETHAEPGVARWFHDHAAAAADDRLSKINDRYREEHFSRLESVRRTADFCAEWPKEIAALGAKAEDLERRAVELESALGAANINHLRHQPLLDEGRANLTDLRRELESLRNDFDKLPQRLEKERRLIVAARRQDENFLRGKMHVEAIDAELLNAYLLRDQTARQLDDLMTWLRRIRQVAGAGPAPQPAATRGEDVLFAGLRPAPNFLIRNLELRGESRLMGRPVQVRGVVSNLTIMPSLPGKPMELRLSAEGSTPCEVRATIDRNSGRARDELFVDCREFPIGGQSLGRAEQLSLVLAPSTGSLTASVRVDGDKLTGEIQLVQTQVRMTPSFASSESELGPSFEQSLGQLESLATRISLDGTIDRPACSLWSNLGPAVSTALEKGLQQRGETHVRGILVDAQRHVDERLAELERQLAEHREQFAAKTASLPKRIDAMDRAQMPRERMSGEQVGRRLPTTSILR